MMERDNYNPFKPKNMDFSIPLYPIINALSNTIDCLNQAQDLHSKRVAMMAVRCAQQLNWNKSERDKLFELALVHDLATEPLSLNNKITNELGLYKNPSIKAYQLLHKLPSVQELAWPILHIYNDWRELEYEDIPTAIKLMANLIQLCEFIDIQIESIDSNELLSSVNHIVSQVREHSGTKFSPQLVDSFTITARDHSFWLGLHPHVVTYFIQTYKPSRNTEAINIDEFYDISLLFLYIVNQSSHSTTQHCRGVGLVARYLAELLQLPILTCKKLEIAGYLHDLGKLCLRKELLNKQGYYNEAEKAEMQSHVKSTLTLMAPIQGIEDIKLWIQSHHERLDGSGYPAQLNDKDLPLEAKILALSDCFQALSQERPHRSAFSTPEILSEINKLAKNNKMDNKLTALLCKHFSQCYKLANHLGHHSSSVPHKNSQSLYTNPLQAKQDL